MHALRLIGRAPHVAVTGRSQPHTEFLRITHHVQALHLFQALHLSTIVGARPCAGLVLSMPGERVPAEWMPTESMPEE